MSGYTYSDEEGFSLRIERATEPEGACVWVIWPNAVAAGVRVPRAERQEAAEALAGDGWRVIEEARLRLREMDQPPTIDPADVKVGDVVEVEADDGSWLVRGEVKATDGHPHFRLLFGAPHATSNGLWPNLKDATVRLVRRAEPEPDPEQVEALSALLNKVDTDLGMHNILGPENYARELVRRGVTVERGH